MSKNSTRRGFFKTASQSSVALVAARSAGVALAANASGVELPKEYLALESWFVKT